MSYLAVFIPSVVLTPATRTCRTACTKSRHHVAGRHAGRADVTDSARRAHGACEPPKHKVNYDISADRLRRMLPRLRIDFRYHEHQELRATSRRNSYSRSTAGLRRISCRE